LINLKPLYQQLDQCLGSDRFRLRGAIQRLKRKFSEPALLSLQKQLAASTERRKQRHKNLPVPEYPNLPVSDRREEIKQAIAKHQVVILCGETGSGKTTQLPKMCLELGRGVDGLIAHTQPRRLAARSVAERIAEELHSSLGQQVGYKVRFHDQVSPQSYIKLMTDGILLAEIQNDRFLNQYDTIIIDEAHERSLNIDFLLGYLHWLLARRKDLKLIVTSATIDTERFSRHFHNAPIIEVSGRTYPVEIRYQELCGEDSDDDRDMTQGIVEAVDELHREALGDILIFLPGEREIRETSEALRKHLQFSRRKVDILPLFARLSSTEQQRIFHPTGCTRIVLATNVAETSLTVPRIKYVIDPGTARISRYSWRSRVQRLQIEKISQASANQRSGRCGRVSEGIAIRLYSEDDFNARPEYTDPEILRTNLASVILQMSALRLGKLEQFPFVEAPDRRLIQDGFKLLHELGAVDKDYRINTIGRDLSRLPLDPRLARMILAAEDNNVVAEVLVIVSALSVQDPRERPMDRQQAADQQHSRFKDTDSDFISFLKLWEYYQQQRQALTQSKLRQLCKKEFIAYMRMREWGDIHYQLQTTLNELRGNKNSRNNKNTQHTKNTKNHSRNQAKPANTQQKKRLPNAKSAEEVSYDAIHRSLLAGLLSHVGMKDEEQNYVGANNRKFLIFPGSGLRKTQAKWIMAASLVDTAKLYARTVAKIEVEWLEQAAKHLSKHHYSEPHWQKRASQVGAYERVSLYGLTIYPRRRINYGPIDPVESREIFIRHALVYGEYYSRSAFFKHNQQLIADIEALEAKSRRRDILVDEEILYDFYAQHIPAGLYNGRAFEKWRKSYEHNNPKALFLERDFLMQRNDDHVHVQHYPNHLSIGDVTLPLDYNFEPGQQKDGVTVKLPAMVVHQMQAAQFDYLVPGMLEEKISAIIKALPKQVRKQFIPAPDYAKACAETIEASDLPLIEVVADTLFRMTGNRIPAEALKNIQLPEHLQPRFEVVDEKNKLIKAGRELEQLKKSIKQTTQKSFARLSTQSIERTGIATWDFANLASTYQLEVAGLNVKSWPALEDKQDSVAIRLFDSPNKADQAHQKGLLRLFILHTASEIRPIKKALRDIQKLCLYYSSVGKCPELTDSILVNTLRLTFLDDQADIRTQADFEQRLQRRGQLLAKSQELCHVLGSALQYNHEVRKALKGRIAPDLLEGLNDINEHLQQLVFVGFLEQLSLEQLRHYPRYLKGILLRLEKLKQNPSKDRQLRLEMQPLWLDYKKYSKRKMSSTALQDFRWQLEELRISLFAQQLGTNYPVSVPRLKKIWREQVV